MTDYNDSDIEYVLMVLDRPELEETDKFRLWMQNSKHRELYYNARAAYDGLALKEKSLPDTQIEWERLLKRLTVSPVSQMVDKDRSSLRLNKYNRLRKWTVAASFLLVMVGAGLMGYWLHSSGVDIKSSDPVALMEIKTSPQEVLLKVANGQQVVLSQQSDQDSLALLGTTMNKEQKLLYSQVPQQKESILHTLSTPRGKDFKLVLSDGTEVWLNAESTLRYPSSFIGDKRIVELTGEAYFQVAKDERHPFIVKTDGIETQVLGTSFNFRNYAHSIPHVTLVEGKVLVTGHQTSVNLAPGEDAEIQKDGTIRIQQVDIRNYTAWTNGYFYFENTSLSDIMGELGRWYNLTILFNDPRAMNYHFNLWAKRKDPIENVLALINGLGKVKITVKENILTVN